MRKCSCRGHGGFLTAKGLEEAAQRELELNAVLEVGLTPDEEGVIFDKYGSVSGSLPLGVHWDDELTTDDQYRRFLNAS